MNHRKRLLLVSAVLVVLGVLGLAPVIASAQSSTTNTTCPGCGPGPDRGDGTKAYSWPEHYCDMTTGRSYFDLIVGLGPKAPVPYVTVYVAVRGDAISKPVGTVRRGKQVRFPSVYSGNSDTLITVALFNPDGTQFPFYGANGTKVFDLVCDCPQPPTTSTPSTVTTPTTGPTSQPPTSPTSAPGTTLHGTTSVPGAPNATLPATGPSAVVRLFWLGFIGIIVGILVLLGSGVLGAKDES